MSTQLTGQARISGRIAFQDPAELTASNRQTIIDATDGSPDFVAFPVLQKAANGDYLMLFHRSSAHNGPGQKAVLRRSTDQGIA